MSSDKVQLDGDPDSLYVISDVASRAGISLLYDLPLTNLRRWRSIPETGRLFAGRPLLTFPYVQPIEASLYESEDTPEIPGHLSLHEQCLRFDPSEMTRQPIIMPLLGNLETGVVPHPKHSGETIDFAHPNSPHVLVVNYLKDPTDEKSMTIRYFAGRKCDINLYRDRVREGAKYAQNLANYVAPNPNDIQVPESKSVPVRRSSFSGEPPVLPGPRRTRRPAVAVEVEIVGVSQIFERKDVILIQGNLPSRFRASTWRMLFQLSTHGCSYLTLYSQTEKQEPLVLLILTDSDDRIGAFLPNGLKRSRRYYGTGEIFVFRISPQFEAFRWSQAPDSNEFFMASSTEELCVGGGGGAAIWLGDAMQSGRSDECKTFASPRLTRNPTFKVIDLEVWKIGATRSRP